MSCLISIIGSFLRFFGSLGIAHHRQDVRWQTCFVTEVVLTQPSFLRLSEVPGDCNNRILFHVPGVTRVLEWAAFPGAFLSSACEVETDLTLYVFWEGVHSGSLGVEEIEHSHGLFIEPSRFGHFRFLSVGRRSGFGGYHLWCECHIVAFRVATVRGLRRLCDCWVGLCME